MLCRLPGGLQYLRMMTVDLESITRKVIGRIPQARILMDFISKCAEKNSAQPPRSRKDRVRSLAKAMISSSSESNARGTIFANDASVPVRRKSDPQVGVELNGFLLDLMQEYEHLLAKQEAQFCESEEMKRRHARAEESIARSAFESEDRDEFIHLSTESEYTFLEDKESLWTQELEGSSFNDSRGSSSTPLPSLEESASLLSFRMPFVLFCFRFVYFLFLSKNVQILSFALDRM